MKICWNLTLTLICFMLQAHKGQSSLSKRKCEEYAAAVFEYRGSPTLSMKPKTVKVSNCGSESVPLIVGGTQANEKEFPHMAVIGYGESPGSASAWKCGGSLISEQHILTAAHCTIDRQPPKVVRLGSVDLNGYGEHTQDMKIKKIIRHPDFHPPIKYNDIAIIVLDSPVKFTAFARPACLDVPWEAEVSRALATGFGSLSYNKQVMSPKLMKVALDIIPNDKCSEYIEDPRRLPQNITSSMLCAGVLEGGKDTCSGDSGGPLQITLEKPYCMFRVIGVTSFGTLCGHAYSPAVYTRVSFYLPWIESVVWGQS